MQQTETWGRSTWLTLCVPVVDLVQDVYALMVRAAVLHEVHRFCILYASSSSQGLRVCSPIEVLQRWILPGLVVVSNEGVAVVHNLGCGSVVDFQSFIGHRRVVSRELLLQTSM